MYRFDMTVLHPNVRFGINLKFWEKKWPKIETHRLETLEAANALAEQIIASGDKFEMVEPKKKKDMEARLQSYRDKLSPFPSWGRKFFTFKLHPRPQAETDVKQIEYKFLQHILTDADERFSVLFNNNTQLVYRGKGTWVPEKGSASPYEKPRMESFSRFIQQQLERRIQEMNRRTLEVEQGRQNQAEIMARRDIHEMQKRIQDVRI